MPNVANTLPSKILDLYLIGKAKDLRMVSAILRNGPGGWRCIGGDGDGDGHFCMGVRSVDQDNDLIIVNYDFTASLVIGFSATIDEYYATNGPISCGASCGLENASIMCGGPLGKITPANMSPLGNIQFMGLFL